MYTITDIARLLEAVIHGSGDYPVEQILTDSRKLTDPAVSLFFALKTPHRDGHQFVSELYQKGVRSFVVAETGMVAACPEAVFVQVDDTLQALQQLAVIHRSSFSCPVIGITGSNGKTIVKEWLFHLLQEKEHIIRSPRSYNSQTGVPLSIWGMQADHTLGIFEAGISEQGEMLRLEKMIRPTIGVLTNIGEAHSEGFNDDAHKLREKLVLFRNAELLIARDADLDSQREWLELMGDQLQIRTWGYGEDYYYSVLAVDKSADSTTIVIRAEDREQTFTIPFTDDASVENAISAACVILCLKADVFDRMQTLQRINMRLELKKGINQCVLINDSYSADLSSLEIALSFLQQQSTTEKKTVILSDLLQSAIPDKELYRMIAGRLHQHGVTRLIGIGDRICQAYFEEAPLHMETDLYASRDEFLSKFRASSFQDETILIKGARVFAFEEIVQMLEEKAHQTRLEINLNALAHNLKQFRQQLKPGTKVMAMVKAFAYGSGGAEIAGVLQYHQTDYLGVAYADEGVALRRAGIRLPIMVMNPEESAFDVITEFKLEPDLYSFEILNAFEKYVLQEGLTGYPVHLEAETGMNRLGFSAEEIPVLAEKIKQSAAFKICSVFSHLAASEDAAEDEFTMEQFNRFQLAADQLQQVTGQNFLRHISNTAAAVRHPGMMLDMVRLGIGLYGVNSAGPDDMDLQPVATLKSTIAQIKEIKAGESVSYNRRTVFTSDARIATIRLGYADGFPRRLGNGVGEVLIQGQRAKVTGTVCMDMFMADITHIAGVREGDEVIIFGTNPTVSEMAEKAGTIPYEIMTGISQRVRRVYFQE